LRKGFLSLILVLLFAASLFAIMSASRSAEAESSSASLRILRLEQDYYLRSSLRQGMRSALAKGGFSELQNFAEFAANYYSVQDTSISFWCAQSSEHGLAAARKWGFTDVVEGICVSPINRTTRIDFANPCELMLAKNSESKTLTIARANSTRVSERGELCAYPALAGSAPSVFAATIAYDDGNESIALLPEGTVIHYG